MSLWVAVSARWRMPDWRSGSVWRTSSKAQGRFLEVFYTNPAQGAVMRTAVLLVSHPTGTSIVAMQDGDEEKSSMVNQAGYPP